MTVLRAEIYDDDAFADQLLVVVFGADALQSLCYFQIGRNLQVVAGGNSSSLWQLAFSRGSAS